MRMASGENCRQNFETNATVFVRGAGRAKRGDKVALFGTFQSSSRREIPEFDMRCRPRATDVKIYCIVRYPENGRFLRRGAVFLSTGSTRSREWMRAP